MTYTLLTAAHPLRTTPEKMDARREQEYYDRAAAALASVENSLAAMQRLRRAAGLLLARAGASLERFGQELTEPRTSH